MPALNRDDWRKLAGSWLLRIALVYAAALAVTLIWDPPNEPARILTSIRHIAICLTFVGLTTWLMARDQRHQDQFIRWFGWIALFGAAAALWMFYSAHPITDRFVAGYWSNPNTAGAIFGLAVVAIASVATSDWIVARLRWIDLIPALVLCACIVLTGSRAALAAVVASLLACFIIVRLWKPLAWSLAGGGVLFVVALVFNWADLARWTARLGGGARLEAWSHFWDLARQRLWTGYGIENEFAYRHRLGEAFSGETLDNPHNMLLSSVFYGGLPAGAAYLALAVAQGLPGYRGTPVGPFRPPTR